MTKRADFLRANKAKRRVTPGFILQVRPRDDADGARLGITVTKKIGNAVVRNRMKRRFRALAREVLAPLARVDTDYVLIGREGGIERDFGLLKAELNAALSPLPRAGGVARSAGEGDRAHPPSPPAAQAAPPASGRGDW